MALAAVCIFWGTTYLTIRMALETFPPLVLVCARFLLSGGILVAGARIRGAHLPRGRELWLTALFGVSALGVGNLCLTYSELLIPSGLAALFLSTSPFWLVGMDTVLPNGERPTLPTAVGLLVGMAGTALLISPDSLAQGLGSNTVKGFLILQAGNICWNAGSIGQRRLTTKAHPAVSGGVQQLAVGIIYLLPAALVGHQPIQWSVKGVTALGWLVVFGSIVGYSAYIYSLNHLPVSLVSIYTYVNPVVAVFLGWVFYREPFGTKEALAVLVIFLGVAIVKRFSPSGGPLPQVLPPASAAE